MAVKSLECKYLLLCVYQSWLSKVLKRAEEGGKLFYKLEGLLHLSRNIDIVNT